MASHEFQVPSCARATAPFPSPRASMDSMGIDGKSANPMGFLVVEPPTILVNILLIMVDLWLIYG